ncbi:MAG: holo-[acyl-carrier-protein] synthase [Candidatus Cloacimonetes bacterium 4572_65]|nr:MAG: holo-[acyl-carrier-protein] synthase [Candidatus Cloacimonetes bacterium 4572_65]
MIYGIGNDIIEVTRIQKAIERGSGFVEKVFSTREIALCNSKGSRVQSYAARFAGKEAFMKALKTGWADGISWREIEILSYESGAPYIELTGKTKEYVENEGITVIHITLSHIKEFAIANVTLECA